ncbi:hypothetical protein [Mycolicibacterium bacteremicum]|uniref:Uncharacterized protein n=1 Tax=Mycolicibacterium bacteremicum TaxID=564198 RepID=A0A1W9YQS4_MYCBA|nr:hypothetical protein [Mycolicibacterium bacteremicum]MCV7434843.1 hypothetical protein [Mycolicibacterium bacteremicum]ORA02140.1 hypothetical protein BST17_24840 [Mycolicibacterium bacteremicum]
MSTENPTHAAEVLKQAFRDADIECDWDAEGHAMHALDALKAAGYADPVKLPEPDEDGFWPVELPQHRATAHVYVTPGGQVQYPRYANTPGSARSLAAALLAAADAAEAHS